MLKLLVIFVIITSTACYAEIMEPRQKQLDSFVTNLPRDYVRDLDSAHYYMNREGRNNEERVFMFYGFFGIHFKYDHNRAVQKQDVKEYSPYYTCRKRSGVCRDFCVLINIFPPTYKTIIMPKMNLDRSVVIDADINKVYENINDFHNWKSWSPWLVLDPDALVNVREDGKYYNWEGKYLGSGEMTVIKEVENKSLDADLLFLKPWKSKAKIGFTLDQTDEGVRVVWKMESSLPFFMFWMKKMMISLISMDYDRGLTMVKDKCELGEIPSNMTFEGIKSFKGCKYIGIKSSSTIDGMSASMEKNYTQLMTYMMDGRQENMDGSPMSIYHKWDMVNRQADYTACIPVHEIPADLPEGMITGSVPATKVHSIHIKGPYRYIGNVWSAQYSRMRGKAFKGNKQIHPMEVYFNSPKNTAENDLETEVWFSVKE